MGRRTAGTARPEPGPRLLQPLPLLEGVNHGRLAIRAGDVELGAVAFVNDALELGGDL